MKNNPLVLVLFLLAGSGNIYSLPGISWQKTLGGSNHEYTWKTIPTTDGGMAFVGFSESGNGDVSGNHGGVDLWVGKLNSSGTVQWSYLYGGTADEEGYGIVQTPDSGYVITGWTDSFDGDVTGHHGTSGSDVWVLKLTSTGILTWAKCYGGPGDDKGAAIVQTADTNYYVAGTTSSTSGDVSGNHGTSSDFWIIKINAAGTLLAQKCVGGTDYDEGINMTLTSDNGCLVCGRTSSSDSDAIGYHGGDDMLIAKLNSSLALQWSKCYGGTETEECNAVVQLGDGSYAALGYTSTQNNGDVTGHHGAQGADDFWLLKLTSGGGITWAKCYGGSGDDQADALIKTSDGGFMMVGLTNSTDGDVSGFHAAFFDPDVWVIKVTGSGAFQWQRCCGGSGQDEGFNVFEVSSGVFVVTAFTYSNDYDVSGNHGNADGWLFKISAVTSIDAVAAERYISLYPNPSSNSINWNIADINCADLLLNIYSMRGELMLSTPLNPNEHQIDTRALSNGMYIVEIKANDWSEKQKIIVQR